MVMTDVGARCPDCAPRRKLPQFEVSPLYLLCGLGAAIAAGIGLGLLWGLIIPGSGGFFAIFIGLGLGYGAGEAVSLATNRKTAPILQILAALAVVLAFLIRNVVWADAILISDDFWGYVAVAVGVFSAAGRFRF
jgi:hypothetical protein